ncbi:MAG: GNAT family N-acetyltransferase [Bacteroidales bacterium]|nr:GNAT family N-acetyltransferase [Bacteroidales bacterium]
MIRYITHNEIDKEKWNHLIAHSLYPSVFADYDFLTYVVPDWDALIDDDYAAAMPLPVRKKFGVRYVFTPYGLVRLGIFSAKKLTDKELTDFVSTIPTAFKQIDLFMNPENICPGLKNCSVEMISHQLDLSPSYDELWASFSENCRRNIKKAEKGNLTLTSHVSLSEVLNLFKTNKGKEAHIVTSDAEYQLFEKIANYASEQGWVETIGAIDGEGCTVAAALFLKDFNTYRFWFSGRDFSRSAQSPLFFIMNEFIKKHQNENAILDFDGSRDENVSRFYKGFGGVRFTFPMLQISRKWIGAPLLKWYRHWRKWLQ